MGHLYRIAPSGEGYLHCKNAVLVYLLALLILRHYGCLNQLFLRRDYPRGIVQGPLALLLTLMDAESRHGPKRA